jgi:uncharacterized protein YecE (DUF72 family)
MDRNRNLPIIATAAWSIPKGVAEHFPGEGSGLSRYAAVFKGVEINSTFYRHHKLATFSRWADSVPKDFRFALKIPKEITHVRKLKDIGGEFGVFLREISPLGEKLGPLLCQTPPTLTFDPYDAERAFETMRSAHLGPIVLEVRHESWAADQAMALLDRYSIDRVLADPAAVWRTAEFTRPPRYVRLHGKPKIYYSSYSEREIRSFAELLAADSWCVFDNTASGAASQNALTMHDICRNVASK